MNDYVTIDSLKYKVLQEQYGNRFGIVSNVNKAIYGNDIIASDSSHRREYTLAIIVRSGLGGDYGTVSDIRALCNTSPTFSFTDHNGVTITAVLTRPIEERMVTPDGSVRVYLISLQEVVL